MSSISPLGNGSMSPEEAAVPRADRLARWGLLVCAAITLGACLIALNSRVTLQTQIARLEARTAQQMEIKVNALRVETSEMSSRVTSASEQLDLTRQAIERARQDTEVLRRAQGGTARQLASSAEALAAAAQDASAGLQNVHTRVTDLSTEVQATAADLSSTKSDLATHRREFGEVAATTTQLADRITRHAAALSDLERRSDNDIIPFDLRKSARPEAWTVGDIRIELKRTDPRRARYDMVIHADDIQVERRDRTANEPVPLLVGASRLRYEVVVTTVERDRIRGFLAVPKGHAAVAVRRLAAQ